MIGVSREGVTRRVAEHDLAASALGGRAGSSLAVVGVATDDAVKDDDVGGLDLVGGGGDVDDAACDAPGQAVVFEREPLRLGLVCRGQLEVGGCGRRRA